MKIKVWGARGSIPAPGPATQRYGGNTTCLEIRTSGGQLVIVDAGSGLRNLGKVLLREKKLTHIDFIFTHSHWDHLAGFPFFMPAYLSRYSIALCGGPSAQNSLRTFLSQQMVAPYFPVDFSLMKAKFDYRCRCSKLHCDHVLIKNGHKLECHSISLNHPNGGYGFKFVDEGKSFVFLTDNEIRYHHEDGLQRSDYVDFCRGADLLFHDAQYTEKEYKRTKGWGHSTFSDATDLALDAKVKRLGLFHHDPDRTDDDMDRQVEFCRKRVQKAGSSIECFGVVEGMTYKL